jgi:hypothetical protein
MFAGLDRSGRDADNLSVSPNNAALQDLARGYFVSGGYQSSSPEATDQWHSFQQLLPSNEHVVVGVETYNG